MLLSTEMLLSYGIRATDGDIGSVHDLLFDDVSWMIRYVTVDTGGWLPGRRVLLSPSSLGPVRPGEDVLRVQLSRKKVEDSPPIYTHRPVSRQEESELSRYYGWRPYWPADLPPVPFSLGGVPGEMAPIPPLTEDAAGKQNEEDDKSEHDDPHLRSAREVRGYGIQARDGEIGHVENFLIDTSVWWIQSMVADTRNWLPGKKVTVSPLRIEGVKWDERKVLVGLNRDEIKSGPPVETTMAANSASEG